MHDYEVALLGFWSKMRRVGPPTSIDSKPSYVRRHIQWGIVIASQTSALLKRA